MYRSDSGAEKVDHQDECVMTENGADVKKSIHAYKISRPPSSFFKNVSSSNKKSTHFDASHVSHTALRRTNSYSPTICPSSLSRKRVSRKISTSAPGAEADHHLTRSAKRHCISKDKARRTTCDHANPRPHSFSRPLFRDEPVWMHQLQEKGYAIVPGVLTEDECVSLESGFWNWAYRVAGVDSRNPETWDRFSKGVHRFKSSMVTHKYFGHEQFLWDVRQNEKVIGVFKKIFGTRDLTSSFDGGAFGLPPEITKNPHGWAETQDGKQKEDWFHLDHSPTRNNFECVQGWVTARDVYPGDETLKVLVGSHKYLSEFADRFGVKSTNDKFKMKQEHIEWYKSKGCSSLTIEYVPRGSIVLWDSRTVHCSRRASRTRARPNVRVVSYVCMVPRSQLTPTNAQKKRRFVEEGIWTTCWPAKHMRQKNVRILHSSYEEKGYKVPKYVPPRLTKVGAQLAGWSPENVEDCPFLEDRYTHAREAPTPASTRVACSSIRTDDVSCPSEDEDEDEDKCVRQSDRTKHLVIDLTRDDDDDAGDFLLVDSDDKEEDTQCTGHDAATKSIHRSPRTQTDVQEKRHENAECLAPVTRFIRKEIDSPKCMEAASVTPKRRVDQSRAGIAQRDDHTRAATERARVECITKEKVVTESLVRVHCEAERVTKKRRETILITHVPHMGTARMARKGAWNFRKRQEVARVTRNIRHKKQVTHDRAWRARYEERKEATRKRAAAAIAADKKVTERTRVECITKEGAEAKKKQTVPSSSTDDVGVNSHEICSQDLPELFTTEQAEEKQAEEKRKSRKRKRVSFDLTKNEVRRVPRRVKANNKAEAQRKAEAEARRRSRSHDHRSGFRPVCSYFLKGRCKFGDRCRNKHPACFAPTSAQI